MDRNSIQNICEKVTKFFCNHIPLEVSDLLAVNMNNGDYVIVKSREVSKKVVDSHKFKDILTKSESPIVLNIVYL